MTALETAAVEREGLCGYNEFTQLLPKRDRCEADLHSRRGMQRFERQTSMKR